MPDKELRDLVVLEAKRVIELAEGLFKPHEVTYRWGNGSYCWPEAQRRADRRHKL